MTSTGNIVFDIDGTLTDFNAYMKRYAVPYFTKKYGMKVVDPNALEIEDIFDMKNFFRRQHIVDAEKEVKKVIFRYWCSYRFLHYVLCVSFRKGIRKLVRELKRNGYHISIHTSRFAASRKDRYGKIVRLITYFQFWTKGIFISPHDFFFYDNDIEKVRELINFSPDLVFDDKNQIIDTLCQYNIPCICINGVHNSSLNSTVQRIDNFNDVFQNIEVAMGKKNYEVKRRIAKSDRFYNRIKAIRYMIFLLFRPKVLHRNNLKCDPENSIIFASNHRSTLDPLIITSVINRNIHWAALLRFFKANDSIFNNNKNAVLCNLTATVLKNLECFPIERTKDNPKANNIKTLCDINAFLNAKSNLGIFPEGTTRREEGKAFGIFSDSFIDIATWHNSWIQPITIYWNDNKIFRNKVIVNFGKAFMVDQTDKERAMKKFMEIQQKNLYECQLLAGNE